MSRFHHLVLIVGSCRFGVNSWVGAITGLFRDTGVGSEEPVPRVVTTSSQCGRKPLGGGRELDAGGQVAKIGLERPFVPWAHTNEV